MKKNYLKVIYTFIIIMLTGQNAWAQWDGNGKSDNPWLIKTTGDLVTLATNSKDNNYKDNYFRLENDLDMNGVEIEMIGRSGMEFKGKFDGNGHVIRNLSINKPDGENVGLFSYIRDGSVIKNLIVDGACITANSKVGVLVGAVTVGGTIENCLVMNSSVSCKDNGAGGVIVGLPTSATLRGNYYYNCSRTKGSNEPATTDIATKNGDKPGAAIADATESVVIEKLVPDGWAIENGYYYNGTVYYNASKGYIVGPTTWAALQTAFSNASTDADNPTVLTLAADITEAGDSYLNLEGGRKVILDLNDHTLDRHLTEAKTNNLNYGSIGCVIRVSGSNTSLTIRDSGTNGTITGGWSTSGAGCINATNGATLRIEGGTISGNRVQGQGGAIYFSGNFYMSGGTITANAANLDNNNNTRAGSAIFFGSSGDFYMTGGSITGNYCGTTGYGAAGIGCFNGSYTFNVHLSGTYDIGGNQQGTYDSSNGTWSNLSPSDILNHDHMTYVIDGAISPSQTARMIVDAHDSKATITSGWSTYMDGEDPEDYFTLANPNGQGIGLNASGEATIGTLHTITLADGLTASTTQAAPGKPITLSGVAPNVSRYVVTYNDGEDHTDYYYADTNGNAIFHMPNADASVSSGILPEIPYIDADGSTKYCTDFTVVNSSYEFEISGSGEFAYYRLGNGNDYTERWFVIVGTVNLDKRLSVRGNDRLILCDGAALNINADYTYGNAFENPNSPLIIYGQAQGTGTLSVTNTTGAAIFAYRNLTINGGNVIATSTGTYRRGIDIDTGVDFIINRGTICVTSDYGIFVENGTLTQNGGTLSAIGSKNYCAGLFVENGAANILGGTLNATGTDDADGIFVRNTGTLTLGWTNATDRITASSYRLENSATICVKDGQILTDGTNYYSGTLGDTQLTAMGGQTLQPQPAAALAMNSMGIMTYASPYALDLSNVNAYVVSSFDNTNSTLTLTKVTEAPANTGLLLKAKNDEQKVKTIGLPLKASAEAITSNLLVGVTDGATVVPQTDGDYTNFILANGTYGIDWYTLSEAGTIGANKAYLQLQTANLPSLARGFAWVIDGEITKIGDVQSGTLNIEHLAGAWYTLDGRKLYDRPTQKGMYIHNGRKTVIK